MDKWTRTKSGDFILSLAHTIQAIVYTSLAATQSPAEIPLFITLPNGRPGGLAGNGSSNASTSYVLDHVLTFSPLWLIVAFFFITGFFHLVRVGFCGRCGSKSAVVWSRKLRWIEYSITSTLMIYVILMLSGISDIYALAGCGGANLAMILFGFAGDLTDPSDPWGRVWVFVFGSIVGLVPWIVIFVHVGVIGAYVGSTPLVLVYSITINLFSLFFCFAVVEFLYIQTFFWSREGLYKYGCFFVRWNANYQTLDGEKAILETKQGERRKTLEWAYQVLSAVAKTLLGGLTAAAVLTT